MKLKNILLTIPLVFSLSAQEVVKIPMTKVEFSQEVRKELYDEYKYAKTEIPFCLYGSIDGRKIIIDEIEKPIITESSELRVDFDRSNCDMKRYLGMIHNHLSKGCSPGYMDNPEFKKDKNAMIYLIACRPNEEGHMDMSAYFKGEK